MIGLPTLRGRSRFEVARRLPAMPRPFRLDFAGACWHVCNRGVDRREIFLDDDDRRSFVDLLGQIASEYRWRVFAWTEMTNHYHVFHQTLEPTLSRGMQALNGEYALRFNRKYRRFGALFQSRFRGELVDTESYLLELSRYIVLNPVRAHMVEEPGQWRWSSYAATAGFDSAPEWLDTGFILDRFDEWDRAEASRRYREFVASGIGRSANPWEGLRAGVYLGSEQFIRRVEELTRQRSPRESDRQEQLHVRALDGTRIASIVEASAGLPLVPKTWRNDRARHAYALLAREEAVATYAEIGQKLGLSPPGARALNMRAARRLGTDRDFAKWVGGLILQISQLKKRV